MINYQKYINEVKKRVNGVIEGGSFILGREVQKLEKKIARYLGVKHAIGVNSGTDALIYSLKSLGINSGDEIIFGLFKGSFDFREIINPQNFIFQPLGWTPEAGVPFTLPCVNVALDFIFELNRCFCLPSVKCIERIFLEIGQPSRDTGLGFQIDAVNLLRNGLAFELENCLGLFLFVLGCHQTLVALAAHIGFGLFLFLS